ncbi:MAG: hypothetical protein AAF429_14485 [Pseudomonadota bacterium]
MAAPPPTLGISPTIAPSSSTGSDLHQQDQMFDFGGVYVGASQPSPVMRIARDIAVGVAVAIAVRYMLKEFKIKL